VEGFRAYSKTLSFGLIFFILSGVSWAEVRVPRVKESWIFTLEDVSFYARAEHFPDAHLAFSSDGHYLALGTFTGRVLLFTLKPLKLLWERRIPEGMAKRVAFSPDSKILYVGEQGPDGCLYAFFTSNGKEYWRFCLAKDLERGTPPEKGDIYGIYRQPGIYRLLVLPSGDLLILGIHSWYDKDCRCWRRLSRLYRLTPSGKLSWTWPERRPAPLTFPYADTNRDGSLIGLVSTLPSEGDAGSSPFTPETFYLLDGKGREIWRYRLEPLRPYFDRVSVWESVGISPKGEKALIGTADGRAIFLDLFNKKIYKVFSLGAPIKIGEIPVTAHVSYGLFAPDGKAFVVTASSSIPYGMPLAVNRPAGPHPNANTLFALQPGKVLWRYAVGFHFQGLATDARGKFLAVAAGASKRDFERIYQFGVFVFETDSGDLLVYYPTEGPCFFHLALSPSGRYVALVETPFLTEQELVKGSYRLHVIELNLDELISSKGRRRNR